MIAVQSLQPEYFALYHLCLTTGMLIAELLGLKWQDLEWDRQTIKVKRQLQKKPKVEFYFDSLKTKTGLPEIRIHDLRHTAATQMLINGVDILTVSKRLGHIKSSGTLDIYGHMIPEVQEKAAQIMDAITTPISFSTKKTTPGKIEFF